MQLEILVLVLLPWRATQERAALLKMLNLCEHDWEAGVWPDLAVIHEGLFGER